MKTTKMLTILVLALAPVASAAQSLTVNGETLDAIILKTGQACTVEVLSDNSSLYSAYVGFDDRVVLGSFDQPLATPEAGDLASITEYDVPSFYGYYVSAAGTLPPPSPGVHFVIEYEPQQVGETELKLYDPTRMTVIATVHITVVAAEMGTVFTYQGRLMEAGNPADGQYDFEFMLYNAPSYGSQLAGTVDVNDLDVINGYFTVALDFGSDAFDGDARWLEISVRPGDSNDSFTTLSPRQEVTATPYALQTRGIFVDSRENIGMGTTSPAGKLHVDGGKAKLGFRGTDVTIKAQDGGDGGGFMGDDAGDGGDIILLPGEGGEPTGLGRRGRPGNVGIGTTTPRASLEVTNTGSSHAIWASTSDIPVYAHRTGTSGTWPAVHGENDSASANTSGVRGILNSTNSGANAAGVYGYNKANDGDGYGVRGLHDGSGIGVYGSCYSGKGVYGVSGLDSGVYGENRLFGQGVYGINSDKGNYGYLGGDYGVYGEHGDKGNYGYLGGSTYGVFGEGTVGVAGYSESNWAGYFYGDVHISGTLSKSAGSFKIDHPLDPENKYLQHSFVESPDMMNVYNGNVVLDENGEAAVQLPEYFEALNQDFRYQLTCIGGFAPVYIAQKISDNRFKIAGGKPGMEISWQVTGVRQDAYAKANRIVAEENKSEEERGYYLYPQAYGFGEGKSIEHLHNQRTSAVAQVRRKMGGSVKY